MPTISVNISEATMQALTERTETTNAATDSVLTPEDYAAQILWDALDGQGDDPLLNREEWLSPSQVAERYGKTNQAITRYIARNPELEERGVVRRPDDRSIKIVAHVAARIWGKK